MAATLAENFARLTTFPASPAATVYVHPGRLAVSAAAESFTTVVGSGAALCVWDPAHRVGGMAHFLLPEAGGAPPAPRYGDIAMKALLEQLGALGGRTYRAALHGGSAPPMTESGQHLGDRNVAAAMAFLRLHAIPLVGQDVGGAGGRKVVFDLAQGVVEVTRVGA